MKARYLLPFVLVVAGCSAPATTATTPPPASNETSAPTTAPATSAAAAGCVTVSDAVAQHLALAMDDDATATEVGGVKSGSSESYVVAVRLAGPETLAGETAVFEVLNIEKPGLTQAVDGFAHQFTKLPESAFSVADPEAVDALTCLSPLS